MDKFDWVMVLVWGFLLCLYTMLVAVSVTFYNHNDCVVEKNASVAAPERQYYELHVNTSADAQLYVLPDEQQDLLRSYCDLLSRVNNSEPQSSVVSGYFPRREYLCWSNKVNDTVVYCDMRETIR